MDGISLGWSTRKVIKVISERFLFGGSRILLIGGGVSIIIMMVVTFITVVGRNSPLAGSWLLGGIEIPSFAMAMVSTLAVAWCWYMGAHIRITIVRDRCGQRIQAILDSVSAFFLLIMAAFIVMGVWELAERNFVFGERTWGLQIPYWPLQLAFCLVMVHFVLVLLRSFLGLAAKAKGHRVEHEGLY